MVNRRTFAVGFTMIESLLAMVVIALLGLAISGMYRGISYGAESQAGTRQAVVRDVLVRSRLSAATRSAKQVLAQGDNYIVLWINDSKEGGTPDLSELRRIEYNANAQSIYSYRAPSTLSDADNTAYDFSTDFNAATNAVKGTAKMPGERWATNVTDVTIGVNAVTLADANAVTYSVTFAIDDIQRMFTCTSTLRSE